MDYIVEGTKFSYSYREVRQEYERFCQMKDSEFRKNLKAALHLACFICYIKEMPTEYCLSDKGIIHELAHELHIGRDNTTSFKEIRELFKTQLLLS